MALEGVERACELGNADEVVRVEQLALDDREVDLDLVEPVRVQRQVDKEEVRPAAAMPDTSSTDGKRGPRRIEDTLRLSLQRLGRTQLVGILRAFRLPDDHPLGRLDLPCQPGRVTDDVQRTPLRLDVCPAHVFTDDAQNHQLDTSKEA